MMSDDYPTAVESQMNNQAIKDREHSPENNTSSLTNKQSTLHNNQQESMEEDIVMENGVLENSSLKNTDCSLETSPINIPNSTTKENPNNDDTNSSSNSTAVTASSQDSRVLSMLNLLPRKRMREIQEDEEEEDDENSKGKCKVEKLHTPELNNTMTEDSNVTPPPSKGSSSPPETNSLSLARLFKKDPDQVILLLSKALSMDSLSSLLKEEHQNNSTQLKTLKEKVEKAHTVLTQCAERKGHLLTSIDEVTEKIQLKRNQLAQTREELRELSMKEGHVKSNRDSAYEKCTNLRKKVHACREAIQQINSLYGKKRRGEKTFKTSAIET